MGTAKIRKPSEAKALIFLAVFGTAEAVPSRKTFMRWLRWLLVFSQIGWKENGPGR